MDMATGIPGAQIDGWEAAGAVNVIYGTPSGLDATGGRLWFEFGSDVLRQGLDDQLWHQDSPNMIRSRGK